MQEWEAKEEFRSVHFVSKNGAFVISKCSTADILLGGVDQRNKSEFRRMMCG